LVSSCFVFFLRKLNLLFFFFSGVASEADVVRDKAGDCDDAPFGLAAAEAIPDT
jgi:hypothetical protein